MQLDRQMLSFRGITKAFQWGGKKKEKKGVNCTCVNSEGTAAKSLSKHYELYCRPNVVLCVTLMPLKTH